MNKVYSAIMGLVVGDALGVPVEFEERDSFQVTDMIGYGTYRQPPGTWSDDSSMTLATLESITRLGRIDLKDIMQNFFQWLRHAAFTPYGEVFDCGIATQQAILRYAKGEKLENCGGKSFMDNGNGALMRILPIVFIPHTQEEIDAVGGLTHAHEISKIGCRLYLTAVEQILKGKEIVFPKEIPYYQIDNLKNLSRDEIKSSGYVVDTLEAALWCFYTTENYKNCVLKAVNLGGDTDTIAAVAGGLAGLFYGCGGKKGIPEEWIAKIAKKDWIKELCDKAEAQFCLS